MGKINKRPQVIQDLIELATYIATDNLDASERFLTSAEETFQQISKLPQMGKQCQLSKPKLADIRQQAIKGFKNHLVFYRVLDSDIEIIRVLHGARDLEAILDDEM